MKYLKDYTDEAISKALDDNEAFFAFSDKQFDEAKKEGTKYVSLGGGLLSPKENAEKLVKAINEAHKRGIARDVAENGNTNIIKRELYNHEAFYTGDITDTKEALKDYPFNEQEIIDVFNDERNKQNA